MEQQLPEIEQQGWRALSSTREAGTEFYRSVLRDDAVMLFPGGLRLTGKAEILASLGAQPWKKFQIVYPTVIPLADGAGVLVYRVRAHREGADPYSALISSTDVRADGAWRLVFHQHTPV